MDNRQEPRTAGPVRHFSTRFLSSDGIPEYNALLDNHLGKRREFLLGNQQALELMQQTGVIERIETRPDNPNQYVVHVAEKPIHRRKRLPPRSRSGAFQLPDSQTMPWRQRSVSRNSTKKVEAAKKVNAATLKGLGRSFSSNTMLTTSSKPVGAASRVVLFASTKCNTMLESAGLPDACNISKRQTWSEKLSSGVSGIRPRSAAFAVSTDEVSSKTIGKKSLMPTTTGGIPHTSVKGTVEHLLESDAAFMTQIRTMNEQLLELENTKAYLGTEIGNLRRKLRGVNAVRENDVAVAHCSSIMQYRLSKAEEGFMKLVTQQQEVKKDVDRVRHELLSLRKVRHKLQEDIKDVTQANKGYEEKIHASKVVRNQLSVELSELERCTEVELEAQRLNLPPEDAVVVDVAKLMGAVQERNSVRRGSTVNLIETTSSRKSLAALQANNDVRPIRGCRDHGSKSPTDTRGSTSACSKTLLDYCSAFRVLQHSLGFADLQAFEQQFKATEEQLLSKYKANLALTDEVAALEKETYSMNSEKKLNRANVRGLMHASEKLEHDMQVRFQATLLSIRSYNELREQRNHEHAKLCGIMLRCLDALQIDVGSSEPSATDGSKGSVNVNGGRSNAHALYGAEKKPAELLEMLQRRMTQAALTLKAKHSSNALELPPEALRLSRSYDGRRGGNIFSTREAPKIVLGPREPSGSALAAILSTVQPPSVENAIVLTESTNMMEVMHGLDRALSPTRTKPSSLSLRSSELVNLDVLRNGTTNPVATVSLGADNRYGKTSVPKSISSMQGLPNKRLLAVMIETENEDKDEASSDEGEEQEKNEEDDELSI